MRRVTCVLVVAHYRGSERTRSMTAVHSVPTVGLPALRVPVMGAGAGGWGGCVLFEKCIVDASISRDIGSDFSDWCCEV